MDAILATIVAGGQALIQLNIEVDKHLFCMLSFDASGITPTLPLFGLAS
jgi:hypothetical protein